MGALVNVEIVAEEARDRGQVVPASNHLFLTRGGPQLIRFVCFLLCGPVRRRLGLDGGIGLVQLVDHLGQVGVLRRLHLELRGLIVVEALRHECEVGHACVRLHRFHLLVVVPATVRFLIVVKTERLIEQEYFRVGLLDLMN